MPRAASIWLLVCAVALFGAGCSHYQLGTEATAGFRSLHLEVVRNDTMLPQAVALTSTALRENFLKDGRVALTATPAEADAVLTITLVDYSRSVAVVRADDTGLGRRFDLQLAAQATLHDRRSGRDIFTARPLTAKRGAFSDSGQLQSEYQALPLLAEQLAEAARKSVLETW